MQEVITINEARKLLDYKDSRSVIKWCEKNGVKIFSEEGRRKKYLIRMQFDYARLKTFIGHLKLKYRERWLEAFKAYMSMNITSVVEMEEWEIENISTKENNYNPQGDHEISFLNSLTKK